MNPSLTDSEGQTLRLPVVQQAEQTQRGREVHHQHQEPLSHGEHRPDQDRDLGFSGAKDFLHLNNPKLESEEGSDAPNDRQDQNVDTPHEHCLKPCSGGRLCDGQEEEKNLARSLIHCL